METFNNAFITATRECNVKVANKHWGFLYNLLCVAHFSVSQNKDPEGAPNGLNSCTLVCQYFDSYMQNNQFVFTPPFFYSKCRIQNSIYLHMLTLAPNLQEDIRMVNKIIPILTCKLINISREINFSLVFHFIDQSQTANFATSELNLTKQRISHMYHLLVICNLNAVVVHIDSSGIYGENI